MFAGDATPTLFAMPAAIRHFDYAITPCRRCCRFFATPKASRRRTYAAVSLFRFITPRHRRHYHVTMLIDTPLFSRYTLYDDYYFSLLIQAAML